MRKKIKQAAKTWIEVFQGQRKQFPQGCAVTRIIPDKRFKQPKYKGKEWE